MCKDGIVPVKKNKHLVREFYSNFSPSAKTPHCPSFGTVHRIEREVDCDIVAQVLTVDKKATLSASNRDAQSQLLQAYSALFRICCGIWLPTLNVTVVLKDRAHVQYPFAIRKKFNLCTFVFNNIMRKLDQRKPDPKLCLHHYRELELLGIPKMLQLGIMPISQISTALLKVRPPTQSASTTPTLQTSTRRHSPSRFANLELPEAVSRVEPCVALDICIDGKLQRPITRARARRIKEKDDQISQGLMIAIEGIMKEGQSSRMKLGR
ncbi:hypothetical protein M9H77_13227 [Catharanthus roseus]|uniref:Uncharacterized protein n=1 Tax=Catharanthus roseus TaxID=4058 RepID=A0ACC0BJV3_CATRO|nr:hypothetical protein M9H77_13227 [Catharanthus roseus]